MAYREPCSSIFLFKGCPCDRSYNNTIYFEDKTAQWVYFRDHFGGGRTKSYTDQYYQRYAKGTLRIQEKADNLYEFNYMAFCNDNGFNPLVGPTGAMKVFYCFIDSIEYINEHTTEVRYTIDVIQSYMFNYRLGMCFVEREHTITDNMYENLVEEEFNGTNYVHHPIRTELIPRYNTTKDLYSLMVVYVPNTKYISEYYTITSGSSGTSESDYLTFPHITWTPEQSSDPQFTIHPTGEMRNNTFSRPYYIFIDLPPFDSTNGAIKTRFLVGETIHSMQENTATILNLLLVPRVFSHNPTGTTTPVADWNTPSFTKTFDISRATALYDNNGTSYAVKNKKLLTYPYCFLKVNNLNGSEIEYMWEHFLTNETNHSFTIEGVSVASPECKCTPAFYQGISNPYSEYSLSIDDFPTNVWSLDTMTQYLAENKSKIGYNAVKNTISDIVSAMSGDYLNQGRWLKTVTTTMQEPTTISKKTLKSGTTKVAIKGGGKEITKAPIYAEPTASDTVDNAIDMTSNFSLVSGLIDISNKPDRVQGNADFSALRNIHNLYGFKFLQTNIRKEDAVRLDNYFSMFGYAIKNVKVPNIESQSVEYLRPHWNYIKNALTVILPKTVNNVTSYVDTDIEEELQAIYNKGITFWMDGEEVGDYSLDNSPNV